MENSMHVLPRVSGTTIVSLNFRYIICYMLKLVTLFPCPPTPLFPLSPSSLCSPVPLCSQVPPAPPPPSSPVPLALGLVILDIELYINYIYKLFRKFFSPIRTALSNTEFSRIKHVMSLSFLSFSWFVVQEGERVLRLPGFDCPEYWKQNEL